VKPHHVLHCDFNSPSPGSRLFFDSPPHSRGRIQQAGDTLSINQPIYISKMYKKTLPFYLLFVLDSVIQFDLSQCERFSNYCLRIHHSQSYVMPSVRTLRTARHMPYGRRKQLECIGFIEESIENTPICNHNTIQAIHIKKCNRAHHVDCRTLYSWWNCFIVWGLAPFEVKESFKRYKLKRKHYKRSKTVTDKVLEVLRGGVDEHPEYYLDEIAEELLIRTQIHLPICTIYKTLTEKALQRNESHRRLY